VVNASFTVPKGNHDESYAPARTSLKIVIDFKVNNGTIDFYVMIEENYDLFKSNQQFAYYESVSGQQIAGMDLSWTPSENTKVFFVWDNSKSDTDKSVSAQIFYDSSISNSTRELLGTFGILLVILGIAVLGYWNKRMPS